MTRTVLKAAVAMGAAAFLAASAMADLTVSDGTWTAADPIAGNCTTGADSHVTGLSGALNVGNGAGTDSNYQAVGYIDSAESGTTCTVGKDGARGLLLIENGGSLSTTSTVSVGHNTNATHASEARLVVRQGGSLTTASGKELYVGQTDSNGGGNSGTLVMEAGSAVAIGGTTYIGVYHDSTGAVIQHGGTFTAPNLNIGCTSASYSASGSWTFDGGTLTIASALELAKAGTATGLLHVIGNASGSDISMVYLKIDPQGTIRYTVVNSDVTLVRTVSLFTYAGTIDLDVSGVAPAQDTVIDLILDTNSALPSDALDGSHLQLAGAADPLVGNGTWRLQLGTTNVANDTLQAVYLLPEPATMGLLGLGTLGLTALRRRKR